MIRIFFVCHGHICRSPMAEFIMKHLVKKAGREKKFFIASAATSDEEIWNGVGNPMYPPAKAELKKEGIPFTERGATRLVRGDYEKYDHIIGMDSANIRNMHRILGGDPMGKISKLMEHTSRGGDVADPWYSDRFDIAFRDIYEGCEALLNKIQKQ